MKTTQKNGMGQWLRPNLWIILADTIGLVLLVSVLLAASGSPALKEWLFLLLGGLPAVAILMLLAPRLARPAQDQFPAVRPINERHIVISPRPADQRSCRAA